MNAQQQAALVKQVAASMYVTDQKAKSLLRDASTMLHHGESDGKTMGALLHITAKEMVDYYFVVYGPRVTRTIQLVGA